jgi:alpha-tubulin suppressor-like RCC1 family protein
LGDATLTSSSIPKAVSGTVTFASISAGNRHSCAVTAAGAAYCWGDNSGGALGTGTSNTSLVPIAVSGGLTFASVSAGRFHTCGVTTGGTAYCWGTALLGDGSTGGLAPVAIR